MNLIKDPYLLSLVFGISYACHKIKNFFGDVWLYNTISELNTLKTDAPHDAILGKEPTEYEWAFIKTVLLGLRKYCVFVLRYVFIRGGKRPTSSTIINTLVITYSGSNYPFDECRDEFLDLPLTIISLPTKGIWRRKEITSDYVIDNFINLVDFILVPILWARTFTKFLLMRYWKPLWAAIENIPHCEQFCKEGGWITYWEEDLWRSLGGDVCIEGLFYNQAFKRIGEVVNEKTIVLYPKEGQGWEKLLEKHIKAKTIGIMFSYPSPFSLNFFNATPESYGVIYPDAEVFEYAQTMFGGSCNAKIDYHLFDRSSLPTEITDIEKDTMLIIFGVNMKQNATFLSELLNKLTPEGSNYKLVVKAHPDNSKRQVQKLARSRSVSIKVVTEIDIELFNRIAYAVVFNSSFSVDLLNAGITVIVPNGPIGGYLPTVPLPGANEIKTSKLFVTDFTTGFVEVRRNRYIALDQNGGSIRTKIKEMANEAGA